MTYRELYETDLYIYKVACYRCRQQGNRIPADDEGISRHDDSLKLGFNWIKTPEGMHVWADIESRAKNWSKRFYQCILHDVNHIRSVDDLTYGELRALDEGIYRRAQFLCSKPSRIKDSDLVRTGKVKGGFNFVETEESRVWNDLCKHNFRAFYKKSYKQNHDLTLTGIGEPKKTKSYSIDTLVRLWSVDKYAALVWVTRAREQNIKSISLTSKLTTLLWTKTREGHSVWSDIIKRGNFDKFYISIEHHTKSPSILGCMYLYHLHVFCPEAYNKAFIHVRNQHSGKSKSDIDNSALGWAFNWEDTPEGQVIWGEVEKGNFESFIKYYRYGERLIAKTEPHDSSSSEKEKGFFSKYDLYFPSTAVTSYINTSDDVATGRINTSDDGFNIPVEPKKEHQVLVKLNKPKKRIKL